MPNKKLDYVKVDETDKGIIGYLKGTLAVYGPKHGSSVMYTKECLEKAFKEAEETIKNKNLFGRIYEDDNVDISMEKVAVCLDSKPEFNDEDGTVTGTFAILNTPCGNIVKQLADADVDLRISPMGYGDIKDTGVEDFMLTGFNVSQDYQCDYAVADGSELDVGEALSPFGDLDEDWNNNKDKTDKEGRPLYLEVLKSDLGQTEKDNEMLEEHLVDKNKKCLPELLEDYLTKTYGTKPVDLGWISNQGDRWRLEEIKWEKE